MSLEESQTVKIRLSVEGSKYIGYVQLPEGTDRMSDLLNDRKPFLRLQNLSSFEKIEKGSDFIINKEHIDYVQVLEENPALASKKLPGVFYKIRVKTLKIEIKGELFVPDAGEKPMDVVNDDRLFLSIRDAAITNTPERYTFLGISKRKICTVEVFHSSK